MSREQDHTSSRLVLPVDWKRFAPVTREQWEQAATASLKRGDLSRLGRVIDGIAYSPYCDAADVPSWWRDAVGGTSVGRVFSHPLLGVDVGAFAQDAHKLAAQVRGASAVAGPVDGGWMEAVHADAAIWTAGADGGAVRKAASRYARLRGDDGQRVGDCVALSALDAVAGGVRFDDVVGDVVDYVEGAGSSIPTALVLHPGRWHQAGAQIAEETAVVVAAWAAVLEAVPDSLRSVVAAKTAVAVPVDTLVFAQVARLRAVRLLVSRVARRLGVAPCRPAVAAVVSARAFCAATPNENLLRSATAVAAALMGGADWVFSTDWDPGRTRPVATAVRIAANLPLVAQWECRLGVDPDPLAGSHFVEALSADLAAAIWEQVRRWSAAGSLAQVLEREPDALVAESAARRKEQVASRKKVVVGVNKYVDRDAVRDAARLGDAGPQGDAAPYVALFARAAALPEAAMRALVVRCGADVPVPRVEFAKEFFASGGFDVTVSPVCTPEQAARQVAEWTGGVCVLCAADAGYAPVVALLDSASPAVYVAKKPTKDEEQWGEGPVTGFVHLGTEHLAFMHGVLDKLERSRCVGIR